MRNYQDTVNILAEKGGILPEYVAEGGVFQTSQETKKALLKAIGYPSDTEEEAEKSFQAMLDKPFKRALPPVVVIRKDRETAVISVTLPARETYHPLMWEITLENGKKISGEQDVTLMPISETRIIDGLDYQQRSLILNTPQELGYHTLKVSSKDKIPAEGRETSLIIVPTVCHMPEKMQQGARPWGFPIQLYALRSKTNWGIGDFTDLKNMAKVAASFGADVVGINPINVAFMTKLETASPYYSSSRMFLNPLYIDVMAIPGAADSEKLQKYISDADFKKKLKKVRSSNLVDYTLVGELKTKAFEILYEDFKAQNNDRTKAFDAFCKEGGKELESAALYQVLAEYFDKKDIPFGFKSWGKKYASPDTPECVKFAKKNADRINYYQYLFWLADVQLHTASEEYDAQNLEIGIYQDLAVGVASESAETWGAQHLFATDLSIGSPPDMFNPNGQEWGVAPMLPEKMQDEAYASYRKVLSANMKRAGAVRIDHVMGLVRLFCIPQEEKGAYLLYPFADIVGIVALESHRNQCLVVGEDLGVVPSFFRDILLEAGILSFRVFRYEQTNDDRYIPPSKYPKLALAAVGTHDMPTLPGYWLGTDIEIAKEIGTFNSEEKYQRALENRFADRLSMVEALSRTGRWFVTPEDFDEEISGKKLPPKLTEAVYAYLAQAPSQLFLAQLEDILGQAEQMNMPGTNTEYPNWRHKLPKKIEDLGNDENMKHICGILRDIRKN